MDGDVLMFAQVMTVIVMTIAALAGIGLGSRVLWRLGSRAKPPAALPHDDDRMQRLETAVDAIAIEVERISEAQRFMVGLLSEPAALARPGRAEIAAPRAERTNTPR
jgi:hypothetical protein